MSGQGHALVSVSFPEPAAALQRRSGPFIQGLSRGWVGVYLAFEVPGCQSTHSMGASSGSVDLPGCRRPFLRSQEVGGAHVPFPQDAAGPALVLP